MAERRSGRLHRTTRRWDPEDLQPTKKHKKGDDPEEDLRHRYAVLPEIGFDALSEGLSEQEFGLPDAWVRRIRCGPPPPKFRMLRSNYYSDPLMRPAMSKEERDAYPTCLCTPDTGCNENCMNRQLYMECLVGRCPTLRDGEKYCANMAIQQRRVPAVEVFKTEDRGWGLRTAEAVAKHTLIIEYMGEVITTDDVEERTNSMTATNDFYFAGLEGCLVLDAGPMGSDARFANHSCGPNCALQKISVAGEPHIMLVALRNLANGEEITYNYQVDTMQGLFGKQVCKCGSRNCSGLIGKRPEGSGLPPSEEWLQKAQQLLAQKTPSLEAMQALIEEAPDTNSCAEYVDMSQRAALARAWVERWEKLIGEWLVGDEDESKPAREAAGDVAGGDGGRAAQSDHETAHRSEKVDNGDASVTELGRRKLIEMADLAELVACIPSGVRLFEATEARQLLTKATKARNSIKRVLELVYNPHDRQGCKTASTEAGIPSSTSSINTAHASFVAQQDVKDYSLFSSTPPVIDMELVGSSELGEEQMDAVWFDDAVPSLKEPDTSATHDQAPSEQQQQQMMDVEDSGSDVHASGLSLIGPSVSEAGCSETNSSPGTTELSCSTDDASSEATTVLPHYSSRSSTDTNTRAWRRPAGPTEWNPLATSMKELGGLLKMAADCVPVCIPELPVVVEVLMAVEEFAARACKKLRIKGEKGGVSEDNEKMVAQRRRDLDPEVLMQDLTEFYGNEHLHGAKKLVMLDRLEEGLADMVSMVIARDEGREEALKAARAALSSTIEDSQPEEQQPKRGRPKKSPRCRQEGKPKGRKSKDSDVVEELHCLCQLPENETKMRMMVACDECKEWYHPGCIHMSAKQIQLLPSFVCPLCCHRKGQPSELACAPPPNPYLRTSVRPSLDDMKAVWEDAQRIPVAQVDAVTFLSCLYKTCEEWMSRARGTIDESETTWAASKTTIDAGASLAPDDLVEDAVEPGTDAAVTLALEATDPTAMDAVAGGQCHKNSTASREPMDTAQDAEALKTMASLVCEHRLFPVTVCNDVEQQLRVCIWKIIAPYCIKDRGSGKADRCTMEMLTNVVEEGVRLGLQHTSTFTDLTSIRTQAMDWLRKAETLSFCQLASLEPFPLESVLDLSGEYGYARAGSALLSTQREKKTAAADTMLCICRGPEQGPMVNCGSCEEWYHFRCVGYTLPAKKGKKKSSVKGAHGGDSYVCIACAEVSTAKYKHRWVTANSRKVNYKLQRKAVRAKTSPPARLLAAVKRPQLQSARINR